MSPVGEAIGTASAAAELIEPGKAIVLRESLSWQGARLMALVGGASGELPRDAGHQWVGVARISREPD